MLLEHCFGVLRCVSQINKGRAEGKMLLVVWHDAVYVALALMYVRVLRCATQLWNRGCCDASCTENWYLIENLCKIDAVRVRFCSAKI